MEYGWDEKKRKRNRTKHGADFEQMLEFDWSNAIISTDSRQDYGEIRQVAFGFISARLHACVYTQRGELRWIISLRKANKREEDFYESQTIGFETADE